MSNNSIIIIGRLGQDPEQMNSGVRLSLAVDRPGKKDDGKKITDWFTVFLRDRNAETAMLYLSKGSLISVVGRMQSNKSKDITYWSLRGDSYTMLGGKADDSRQQPASTKQKSVFEEMESEDYELPPF